MAAPGGGAEKGAQKGRGDRFFNIPSETSAASGLGSHLVGCAQRTVPLSRRAGGGSGENLEKVADARLNSQPGPHPFFHLGFQVGVPATGGEVFRQSWLVAVSQGPTQGPGSPRGPLAYRPGSSCWVLSAATGQQGPDGPFRFPPDDLWPRSPAPEPCGSAGSI